MNVYMPSEAIVEPAPRRFLDWRFLSALAALLFVAMLAVGAWKTWESRERADLEREALISQLEIRGDEVGDLQEQVRDLQRDVTRERAAARVAAREASAERRLLLKRQEYLIRVLERYGILPPDAPAPPGGTISPTARPTGGGTPAPSPTAPPPPPSAPVAQSAPSSNPGPSTSTPGNAPSHSHAGGNGKGQGHGPGGNRPPHAGKP